MGLRIPDNTVRLGRTPLRLHRVREAVLLDDRVPLRPGATADFVARQLHGDIDVEADFLVPNFVDLSAGEIDLGEVRQRLGRDFVTSISRLPELLKVLDDPADTLCVRDPLQPWLFHWDGTIGTQGGLLTALAERKISIHGERLKLILIDWKSAWDIGKDYALRRPRSKNEILEILIGRLGDKSCLEERPETPLLLAALEAVKADDVDRFRSLLAPNPILARDFSGLDLDGLSLPMVLAVLGISELQVAPDVSSESKECLDALLHYGNRGRRIWVRVGEERLFPTDFRVRSFERIKLTSAGATFFCRDGSSLLIDTASLFLLKHSVRHNYLWKIIDEVRARQNTALLDYYEELTEEAIRAGITSPDNYVAGKDTPFQKLMERLLDKYIKQLCAETRAAFPDWIKVVFKRDRASATLECEIKGEKDAGALEMDWRFVKAHEPEKGGFMFASVVFFSRQGISPTNLARLEKVVERWRQVNPSLHFAVH
ncbi:MAG: hypothetical protein WC636_00750 [Candidatus Margulisiibacteriota bacterium]